MRSRGQGRDPWYGAGAQMPLSFPPERSVEVLDNMLEALRKLAPPTLPWVSRRWKNAACDRGGYFDLQVVVYRMSRGTYRARAGVPRDRLSE